MLVTSCTLLLPLLPRREVLVHTLSLWTSLSTATVAVVPDAAHGASEHVHAHGTELPLRSLESAAAASPIDGLLGPMAVYPDPILRRSASPVTRFGPAVEQVANLLVDGMKTNSTTALQYGWDARIVVLRGPASPLASGAPLVLINPTVLSRSGEDKMVLWREYCGDISYNSISQDNSEPLPVLVEVELLRDEVVEVAAQDVRGVPIRKALRGEPARAFQHELDHLDGLLIIDHAGLEELPKTMAQREAPYHKDRQRRAFERKTYQGNEPLYW